MLKTLRNIVQEVSTASSLQSTLDIIVMRVRDAMQSSACAIFLYDRQAAHYLLMANVGLEVYTSNAIVVPQGHGLVGLVGQRAESVNIEIASAHPNFYGHSQVNETRLVSFLGVPIIHHRELLGVLTVQRGEAFLYQEHEEAFLVTITAQLAAMIAHAQAMESIANTEYVKTNTQFKGCAGATGVAIGKAVLIHPVADLMAVPDKLCEDIPAEIALLDQALQATRLEMQDIAQQLSDRLPLEEQALFDVYLHMLDDQALGQEIKHYIYGGLWAQAALRTVIETHVHNFEMMDDRYLRERASDVRDLGNRVLAHLQHTAPPHMQRHAQLMNGDDKTIIISEELTPMMLGQVPKEALSGLVSIRGSSNSHVAILARALGIPTVMGVMDLPLQQLDGKQLIVDGNQGLVHASPDGGLMAHYQEVVLLEKEFSVVLESVRDLPCVTLDQYEVPLLLNTGLISHPTSDHYIGVTGVGLYRTEIPFMMHDRFPSESEQESIYRQQLMLFSPRPVTMRTLDIGGDKALSYFPITEDNPFLGWRGIRVTLDHPEIFLTQIRAMLKASIGLDNLQIMLPMVTSLLEVEEAQSLIQQAYEELTADGLAITLPPLGVMIEVPAAVYTARELAKRVDFLSVGSNDLIQYLLAVDRNNPRVSDLYQPCHPAVLNALQQAVNAAHSEGKKISICGEMAGDPIMAVLLVAMGFDSLSMSLVSFLKVKWTLRRISSVTAKALLKEVLQYDDPKLIHNILEQALDKEGLGSILGLTSSYKTTA